MCRYKNCKTEKLFNSDSRELSIDDIGYCLFHSNNDEWQTQNNFANAYFTLTQKITDKNKNIDGFKWNYDFEGFNFPKKLDIEINKFTFRAEIKFSNCNFKSKIKFTECNIRAITVTNSIFQDDLIFNKTKIINGIYSESVKYNGNFKILNSDLEGNSFFKKNEFILSDSRTEFLIKKCNNIEYVSFEDTSFDISTAIIKSILNKEIRFVNCKINDEFIFDDNVINDSINFNESYFTITKNLNPIYSSTQFENITLTKTGKISFKGKEEQDNVVFNELSMSFKTPPLGLITFENFNLNKIFPKTKDRLLSLEKQELVEIGSGCRKYYCQTEIFTTETTNATQELILSITKIFCTYFELSEHKNLGVEIVERTKSKIRYFYFTDDKISYKEFYDRLISNEIGMWTTFSNLMTHNRLLIEDVNIKLALSRISAFFVEIGILANDSATKEHDIANILNSISVIQQSGNKIIQGKTILVNSEELFSNLKKVASDFYKNNKINLQISINENMKNTTIFSGSVSIGTFVNTENYFENRNVSEEQKKQISNELAEIKNEIDGQKKESRLKKFIKEWSGTITDVGMSIIKNII